VTPVEEKLVADLAAQAGLVLRNVRLVEEIRESRRRLVTAQDTERRRLERDIHDGAQQHLVSLMVKIRVLESLARKDPGKVSEGLGDLKAHAGEALDTLRDLARGIYPPLLADQGLAAAIESQARKSSVAVDLHPDGVGRYPQEVEAAVYFCVLEALQNVAKYSGAERADLTLRQIDGRLEFEVRDAGQGFDPATTQPGSGLVNMRDRLEALGGSLEIRSAPGGGTEVTGRVPVGVRR
jgi:signal transduction histidine kinase